jgi:hypothetical protein
MLKLFIYYDISKLETYWLYFFEKIQDQWVIGIGCFQNKIKNLWFSWKN